MMRGGLWILIGLVSGGVCLSQSPDDSVDEYRKAVVSVEKDLDAELAKLAQLRKRIAAEKPEWSKKAHQSALTLRQKQRQYEIAKATQSHRLEEVATGCRRVHKDIQNKCRINARGPSFGSVVLCQPLWCRHRYRW